ncbi:MAG: aromatic-ring-hydroxylating dioxygenase subunit beta [Deltaproteobacteria bacterium]|nr:aromatic-ring-hydroxylating dioxygenase subunit beta [Deltaproteobacteria bacterium]
MDARECRFAVEELQHAYVHCIDNDRLEEWPDFFTDACRYEVTTRENVEQGLPVSVIYCDSKGMLRDRIVALRQANIYGSHRYRHMISAIRVTKAEGNMVSAETNYAVYRTMLDPVNYGHSELYSVGVYLDTIVIEAGVARFREKVVLVDTARILSLLVTPL